MKRLNQRFAGILLMVVFLCCVQPRESEAFVPIVLAAGAIAGGAMMTIGAMGIYKPSSIPSSWGKSSAAALTKVNNTARNLARLVVGAQLSYNQYAQEQLVGNYAAARAAIDGIKAVWSSADATKYPGMNDLLTNPGEVPGLNYDNLYIGTVNSGSGEKGNTAYVINSFGSSGYYWWPTAPFQQRVTTIQVDSYGRPVVVEVEKKDGNYVYYRRVGLNYQGQAVPREATNQEIAEKAPDGILPSPAATDLDKMIADDPVKYGVSIVDSAAIDTVDDASPLVPPVLAPSVVDVANPATGLNQPTVEYRTGILTTANNNVQTATANLTAAQSAAAADPTNQQLKDALTQAEKELAEAKAQQATASQALQAAQEADEEMYPNALIPELHKLNFDPFKQLLGVLANTFPFSLINSLAGYYEPLVAEGSPPVFTVPMPLYGDATIDLAPFDPVARIFKWLVGIIITSGAVYYIVRFYRGVA